MGKWRSLWLQDFRQLREHQRRYNHQVTGQRGRGRLFVPMLLLVCVGAVVVFAPLAVLLKRLFKEA